MKQKAVKLFCLGVLVLLLGLPAFAQNTKGDRPSPAPRETRFKTPKKSKQPRQPSRRVRRGDDKPARPFMPPPGETRRRERPGKPITPQYSRPRPEKTERAWKGDISGRSMRPRPSTGRAKNIYPQPANINYSSRNLKQTLRANQNPNVKRVRKMQRQGSDEPRVGKPIRPTFHKSRPQQSERAWRGDITGRKIRAGSSDGLRPPPGQGSGRIYGSTTRPRSGPRNIVPRLSGRAKNVFSQRSFYVNKQSQRRTQPLQSERTRWTLGMLKSHNNQTRQGYRSRRVSPRSGSAAYLSNRSINIWAHFRRPKRKGEKAITTDLAGHPLRGRNFETQRPELMNPTLKYQKRTARGERPYKGPAAGGYVSRSRLGRAWLGDIAHRAIRGGFRSKKGEPQAGSPVLGRGPGTMDRRVGKYQGNLRGTRHRFDDQGAAYTGNIRSRKPMRGGGSVSGAWNNKGQPIQGRTPGRGFDGIGYTGNIRLGKRGFRDQGEEYTGNIRGRKVFHDQGEEYSGNIRGRKFFHDQGEGYTGNIKFRRPDKGGGSRSGHWNNNNTPIVVRTPKGKSAAVAGYQGNIRVGRTGFRDQGEEYTGNIKSRRPEKGGGSVSGKLWNNEGRPIEGRTYIGQTRISRYSGKIRASRPLKGGGSVSGKLWNNDERPIEGRYYANQAKINRYSGDIKAKRPEKGGGSASEHSRYTGNLKIARGDYRHNPNSAEDALRVRKAGTAYLKSGQHASGVRRNWGYVKNPSSADDAQRVREPGRAFARSAGYQGNIRIKRFDVFRKSDLHPDAQFVKTNKNNVPEEKDAVTNFKLWWARLFRKAETQPDHLKEKDNDRKPRYDKGEAGLWYD